MTTSTKIDEIQLLTKPWHWWLAVLFIVPTGMIVFGPVNFLWWGTKILTAGALGYFVLRAIGVPRIWFRRVLRWLVELSALTLVGALLVGIVLQLLGKA